MLDAIDPNGAEGAGQPNFDPTGSIPPASFNGRTIKAAYYAMIEQIDWSLGRILALLDDLGELDNTLVIFTSDHGELLGDHGLLYKGCRFFEGLIHVPLIASMPGTVTGGMISDALVELVDIAPTLLEAAGLPIPYFMQGRSLWPILTGVSDPHMHKPIVISDFNDSIGASPSAAHTQATMTFDGRYKTAIYHSHGLGELFDLQEDPSEFDNLWDSPAQASLRNELVLRHLNAFAGTIAPGIRRVDHA
jgi:arylsulfatase